MLSLAARYLSVATADTYGMVVQTLMHLQVCRIPLPVYGKANGRSLYADITMSTKGQDSFVLRQTAWK